MNGASRKLDDTIYLDYHSTTPCDPRVSKIVQAVSKTQFGNPSSPHAFGKNAHKLVEQARGQVAEHIGALAGEIVFTSGATESNNLILLGLTCGYHDVGGDRSCIVTSAIEHKSVLKAAQAAASLFGLEHKSIPVTENGIVDLAAAENLIDEQTLLVSVQAVNNELGTIQPIDEVAELAHESGALFHCDAAQVLGRLRINVEASEVDFLSLSSHKVYGPKGSGALYVSGGSSTHPIKPLMYGGGQESGLRPGTLNVPSAVGFGKACQIVESDIESEIARVEPLRNRFEDKLLTALECAKATIPREFRVASTSSIRFAGVQAEAILARLKRVAVSTGSACEAGAPEPSHVLQAIGYSRTEAYECIRAAIGRFTTKEDVDKAVGEITRAVQGAKKAIPV